MPAVEPVPVPALELGPPVQPVQLELGSEWILSMAPRSVKIVLRFISCSESSGVYADRRCRW